MLDFGKCRKRIGWYLMGLGHSQVGYGNGLLACGLSKLVVWFGRAGNCCNSLWVNQVFIRIDNAV